MFGQNILVRIILPQNKCWFTEIMSPKKLGSKMLVKKKLVTLEILLTWTNVART